MIPDKFKVTAHLWAEWLFCAILHISLFILINIHTICNIYLFICLFVYLFIYSTFCRSSLIIRSVSDHLKPGLAPDALPTKDLLHSSAWYASPLTLFEAKCAYCPVCVIFFGSDTVHVLLTPGFSRNRLSRFKGCHIGLLNWASLSPCQLVSVWQVLTFQSRTVTVFKQLLE